MDQNQILKNSSKFSISSSKKVEISNRKIQKPIYGLKINSKDYESFQNISRNVFHSDKNRLNQTAGYTDALSMAKLRDYTTNDSSYQRDLRNYNLNSRKAINSNQIFKKKSMKDNIGSTETFDNLDFLKKNLNPDQINKLNKESLNKFLKDKNLRHLQKFVLDNSGLEIPKNSEMKITNSTVFLNQNKKENEEGFISQRLIMKNLNHSEIDKFNKLNQSNKFKPHHKRNKTENVEKLVDYINDFAKKEDKKKEKNFDNVDEFLKKNLNRKNSPLNFENSLKSKYFYKSPISKNLIEKKKQIFSATPKNFRFKQNPSIHSNQNDNSSKRVKDIINQSNPDRKQSLNIYKNNLNKSEKICHKLSLHDQKRENDNFDISSPNRLDHEGKIKVYDKNGKSYYISKKLLQSDKKSDSSHKIANLSSQKLSEKKIHNPILSETQKQDDLANQIINNYNVRETNIDFPQIEGVFNTTDIDSYAKEISHSEKEIGFGESMKVDSLNLIKDKKSDFDEESSINKYELLSANDNKQMIKVQKGDENSKKFEIFEEDLNDEENIDEKIEDADLKQKQIIKSKIRNGKAKVFNLCFDNEEEFLLPETQEKKINVSKKDDSGTNFFIINGKRSIGELKIPDPMNFHKVKDKDIQIKNHFEIIDRDLSSSFDSNNLSVKIGNLKKNTNNHLSNERIESDLSSQNDEFIHLYKKPKKKDINSSSERSEKNLYHPLKASMNPTTKKNNKFGGSNMKIGINKVSIGQNRLHSARMIEDLKKFGQKNSIEQIRKKSIASQKKRLINQKNETQIGKNINEAKKEIVKKRRKGHKRNVHSEQYTDIIKQVVKKHDIPVQLEYNNANMTPDLSRKNSLNVSQDEYEMSQKHFSKIENNNSKMRIISNIFDEKKANKKNSSIIYNFSSFEKENDKIESRLEKNKKKEIPSNEFLDDDKKESQVKHKRVIDFMNIEDDSDMKHVKESHSKPTLLKEFEERNKKDIKRFEQINKIESKNYSPASEIQPKAPLPTKEISQHTMAKESSKNSYRQYSKNKGSLNTSSKKNLSFGQVSGRGSKISITITTHKSSKNSDFNNNIVISHSLQNSGIHSRPITKNTNVFKLESPDPGSGSQSPEGQIRIEVQEQPENSTENFENMPTMNPKNMTFNPNNPKTFVLENQEFTKQENKEIGDLGMIIETDIKDFKIPQMGSSYEDSMISEHSDESDNENKEYNQITENTFGKGMNIVLKEAKSKNTLNDSLNKSSNNQNHHDKIPIQNNELKIADKNLIQNNRKNSFEIKKDLKSRKNSEKMQKNIFQNSKVENDTAENNKHIKIKENFPNSKKPVTEFYYEREHIGNGDSSYKLSVSDNSSNLKNITIPSNSNHAGRSSLGESPEIIKAKNYVKVKQAVLRGKLNSPVKNKKVKHPESNFKQISKRNIKNERNDNIIKIKNNVEQTNVENMTHSELIELRNKNARKKFTQIYDNKSAMIMLENSKNKSANISPKKRKRKQFIRSKNTSIEKNQKKKSVTIINSRKNIKKSSKPKHLDFVNITDCNSTLENVTKEKVKKKKNYSKIVSRNNSIDLKKNQSIDKSKKKNLNKLKKKSVTESKETNSNISRSKTKIKKKEKETKNNEKKKINSNKNDDSKNKSKSNLKIKLNKSKQIIEIKIMKHLSRQENIETNLEFYHLQKKLGEGSYAKVHLGISVLCSKKVAIKLYDKSKIKSKTSSERIFTEIDILRRMSHKNIVNLIEIFQNKKYIFIVLEYANGGDLLNYLKNYGRFKESDFRNILQQIVDGLEYIHDHKFLHRDIKLDNILLTKSGQVKICDFGISRKMLKNDVIFEHIGTPAYIAPEIIKEKGYSGFTADIWSLGVTTFMALTGNVPFKGNTIDELHESILTNEIKFPEKVKLSEEMKRAIRGMLIKDPKKRISLKDVCKILDLRMALGRRSVDNYADETIIQEIKSYGYPEKMIVDSLQKDIINHITALYKLLKN